MVKRIVKLCMRPGRQPSSGSCSKGINQARLQLQPCFDLDCTFLLCCNLGIELIQLPPVHVRGLRPLELEPVRDQQYPRPTSHRAQVLRWREQFIVDSERVQVEVAVLDPFVTREFILSAHLVKLLDDRLSDLGVFAGRTDRLRILR